MTTRYVATNGNDLSPTGSISAPYLTWQKGVSVSAPGDTLYIRGGTYAPNAPNGVGFPAVQGFPSGSAWTAGNYLLIQAYPGEVATLRPTNSGNLLRASSIAERYVEISGFDPSNPLAQNLILDSALATSDAVKITNGATGSPCAHHFRFRNVEIKNSQGMGLLVTDSGGAGSAADGCEVLFCKIHDNGFVGGVPSGQAHGIYWQAGSGLITDSELYGNAGYGMQLYHDSGNASVNNNQVLRNRVHENSVNGGQGEILVAAGTGNLIANNLVWLSNRVGIHVWFRISTTANKVYHNTIWACTTGIRLEPSVSGNFVRNNVMHANGTNYSDAGTGTIQNNNHGIAGSGTDPQFVDPATRNFHLQVGSPLRGAGVAVAEVTDDYDRVVRANPPDIGAYEYAVVAAPPSQVPRTIAVERRRRVFA